MGTVEGSSAGVGVLGAATGVRYRTTARDTEDSLARPQGDSQRKAGQGEEERLKLTGRVSVPSAQ